MIYEQFEQPLKVETRRVGEAVVLRLSGHIDEFGADALRAELDKLLESGASQIVFDLGDVMFMGSTGLGQIMRTYRVVKGNGYVRIANPQPLIADLFRLTKLNKLLEIYPSVEKALQGESSKP